MGTGMERGRGQRIERGDRVRPQSGRNCFPLGFSLAPKQRARARDGEAEGGINSPGGRRRRRKGNRVSGQGCEQRARTRGPEGAAGQRPGKPRMGVGAEIPGVPAEPAGAERCWGAWLARTGSSLSPAVPAAARAPLGCAAQAPGRLAAGRDPIFPSGCEGKLGVALESLQGRRDLT